MPKNHYTALWLVMLYINYHERIQYMHGSAAVTKLQENLFHFFRVHDMTSIFEKKTNVVLIRVIACK